jgi:ribosomal protein L14
VEVVVVVVVQMGHHLRERDGCSIDFDLSAMVK